MRPYKDGIPPAYCADCSGVYLQAIVGTHLGASAVDAYYKLFHAFAVLSIMSVAVSSLAYHDAAGQLLKNGGQILKPEVNIEKGRGKA